MYSIEVNILYRLDEIPHEIQKELIKLYLSGTETVSMIRLTYNISTDTFYKLLHRYNVKLRVKSSHKKLSGPTRQHGNYTKKLHTDLLNEVLNEYKDSSLYTTVTLSKTVPDAIIIDWKNRTITAVEAETSTLGTLKERAYTSPIFDKPFNSLIIKTRDGNSKTISLQ